MNDEQLYYCLHDVCKFSKNGKRGNYSVRTDSGLRKHHQLIHLHPCCDGDKRCKVGSSIRKWKIRKTIEKNNFVCQHLNCDEFFTSALSRSNHQKQEHYCKDNCLCCMNIATEVKNREFKTPPFPSSLPSIDTTTTVNFWQSPLSKIEYPSFSMPQSSIRHRDNDITYNTNSVQMPGLTSLCTTATISTLDTIIRCLPGATSSQQTFLSKIKSSVRDDEGAREFHSMTQDQANKLINEDNNDPNVTYKLPTISFLLN